jgi:hypothetical protein
MKEKISRARQGSVGRKRKPYQYILRVSGLGAWIILLSHHCFIISERRVILSRLSQFRLASGKSLSGVLPLNSQEGENVDKQKRDGCHYPMDFGYLHGLSYPRKTSPDQFSKISHMVRTKISTFRWDMLTYLARGSSCEALWVTSIHLKEYSHNLTPLYIHLSPASFCICTLIDHRAIECVDE